MNAIISPKAKLIKLNFIEGRKCFGCNPANSVGLKMAFFMDDKWQVGEGVEAQVRQVFQNLQNILREAGGSLDDVMELTTAAYSRKGR